MNPIPHHAESGQEVALPAMRELTVKESRFARLTEFHGESDLKGRSVRSIAAKVAGDAVDFILRIASIGVLARLLVPEYFGLLAMVTVVTSIAESAKDLGLTVPTIQKKTITHDEVSTLFWINAAGGFVTALIIAACAYPLASFYHDDRLVPVTLVLATTFLWSGLTVQHQALLSRQMKFGNLAIVQISANGVSLAIAIILALRGAGYWALVAREVFRSVFLAAGTWWCLPWIPGRPSRKANVTSMLRFGGDLTAFNLVFFLSSSVDKILVGRLFGATALGIYRQGAQLAVLPMSQLTNPIGNVAQSILSRLQGDPDKYRRSYSKLLTALSAVTMPVMMFLAVFSPEIVLIALGEEWLASTTIFWILAVASIIEPAGSTAAFVMMTCGKSRRYLHVGVAASVAMVVFFFAGIPWGIEGIAFSNLARAYLLLIPMLWWSFKGTPVDLRLFAVSVARPLLSGLLMTGLLYAVKVLAPLESAWATLLLGGVLMLPLYVGIWILLPGGRSSINEVWVDVSSAFGRSRAKVGA